MKSWNEFNELKNKAWQTKTQADYENWKEVFKAWYSEQELNDFEKGKIKEQLEILNEKKTEYFNKQKQHPTVVKNNFILREDEGKAFINLCNAIAGYLNSKTINK